MGKGAVCCEIDHRCWKLWRRNSGAPGGSRGDRLLLLVCCHYEYSTVRNPISHGTSTVPYLYRVQYSINISTHAYSYSYSSSSRRKGGAREGGGEFDSWDPTVRVLDPTTTKKISPSADPAPLNLYRYEDTSWYELVYFTEVGHACYFHVHFHNCALAAYLQFTWMNTIQGKAIMLAIHAMSKAYLPSHIIAHA